MKVKQRVAYRFSIYLGVSFSFFNLFLNLYYSLNENYKPFNNNENIITVKVFNIFNKRSSYHSFIFQSLVPFDTSRQWLIPAGKPRNGVPQSARKICKIFLRDVFKETMSFIVSTYPSSERMYSNSMHRKLKIKHDTCTKCTRVYFLIFFSFLRFELFCDFNLGAETGSAFSVPASEIVDIKHCFSVSIKWVETIHI